MTDLELREAALKAAGDAVGQSRPYEDDIVVAVDAVIAAVRASGRLAPEVGDDVVETAFLASEDACQKEQRGHTKLSLQRTIRLTLETSAPIIAAAAEAKAREEIVTKVNALYQYANPLVHPDYYLGINVVLSALKGAAS